VGIVKCHIKLAFCLKHYYICIIFKKKKIITLGNDQLIDMIE